MSRGKALHGELDAPVWRLVTGLRRLKDHSGLSLRQLAARTGYSAKSWERYLSGRTLPPREAVEALARAGDEDPTRLLALHEVAAEAWNNRPHPETPPPQLPYEILPAGPSPSLSRSLRIALAAGAVTLVLALTSTVLLALRLNEASAPPPTATAPAPVPSPPAYTCRIERIDGRWQAGLSRVDDELLAYGDAGPDVAEAQCLLRRAGVSPGGIDGLFGPLTRGAVKSLQKRAGLVVDGLIGPLTWKELRG
ncbi:peptidoglycan-binding protein [Streptomyces phaeoluteigriseus]|uniref:Peptidoglycan-binding protein n=1 Tax=Streptomyces phaeoluteigriseus TaxID=114686 RepID=A0ABY4Z197_9ACTN|nr:peptidoglycan-binding protein [Streptomyces phaeoluteigriseus]USQ82796.1 peptidoglycan-binding protein [Streptomyces phaeoluteigriseus]